MSRKKKNDEQREQKPDQEKQGKGRLDERIETDEQTSQPGQEQDVVDAEIIEPTEPDGELIEDDFARNEKEEIKVETEKAEWEQEKEKLLDQLKRKQAEMENLRRISKMEQAEAREYGIQDFLSKLLPVLDNLERALESARSDHGIPDAHINGLEMIYKQFMQILEQEGVSTIEAQGTPFDPNCHHAVMEVESDEEEPGNVVEELQKGYWHRKRVLRPAMVKVCRE